MKVQYFLSDNTYSSFWCKCWNTYCLYAVFIRPIKMFSCFAILSIILKIMASLRNVSTFFSLLFMFTFSLGKWTKFYLNYNHGIGCGVWKKIEYLKQVKSKGWNSMIIKREMQNYFAKNKSLLRSLLEVFYE
jgi:hypothetical protein